jgi:hypothetical protein
MNKLARREAESQTLKEEAQSAEAEARMVVPGIQALFGFQMIAVFNQRFEELALVERSAHIASLVLVAISIALILAPAAYHRIAERGIVSRSFIDLASGLIAWAMASLALGIAIDIYVAARLALESHWGAGVIGTLVAGLLAWLWFGLPLQKRSAWKATAGM